MAQAATGSRTSVGARSDRDAAQAESANEVHLIGRVAAAAASRSLPSGDVVTVLRVVVDRPASARRSARTPSTDTVDCAIWIARIRQRAQALLPGTVVEIEGSLRRRFWRTPGGAASRYEVEVHALRRVPRAAAVARGRSG